MLFTIANKVTKIIKSGPARSKRGNLSRARARGAGSPRTNQTLLLALLRDYATQKRWPWNREGGKRTRTGTRDFENSRPDGRAQRSRGAWSDHKNTLPLEGRVEELLLTKLQR